MNRLALENRRAMFQAFADLYDEDNVEITHDLAREVRNYGAKKYRPELHKRHIGDMQHWLEHPEKFSPWVDWVAVNRATDYFDLDAYLNLSELEKQVFAIMLAMEGERWVGYDWVTNEVTNVHRRAGWLALPENMREVIKAAVANARADSTVPAPSIAGGN